LQSCRLLHFFPFL